MFLGIYKVFTPLWITNKHCFMRTKHVWLSKTVKNENYINSLLNSHAEMIYFIVSDICSLKDKPETKMNNILWLSCMSIMPMASRTLRPVTFILWHFCWVCQTTLCCNYYLVKRANNAREYAKLSCRSTVWNHAHSLEPGSLPAQNL